MLDKLIHSRKWWIVQCTYFVVLALLMWLPMGGLPIDVWTFGLRPDHFVHATIYLLCPLMLWRWVVRREGSHWQWALLLAAGVAVGHITEYGQILLPYRSFDINDLIANMVGVTIGWAALRVWRWKRG